MNSIWGVETGIFLCEIIDFMFLAVCGKSRKTLLSQNHDVSDSS